MTIHSEANMYICVFVCSYAEPVSFTYILLKVEVAVPGFPSPIILMVSVDVKQD